MLPAFEYGSAIDWTPTFPEGWGTTNTRGCLDGRCFRVCYEVSDLQTLLRRGANSSRHTHRLGCDGIGEVLATLGAIDVSSVFDHGKSVADA